MLQQRRIVNITIVRDKFTENLMENEFNVMRAKQWCGNVCVQATRIYWEAKADFNGGKWCHFIRLALSFDHHCHFVCNRRRRIVKLCSAISVARSAQKYFRHVIRWVLAINRFNSRWRIVRFDQMKRRKRVSIDFRISRTQRQLNANANWARKSFHLSQKEIVYGKPDEEKRVRLWIINTTYFLHNTWISCGDELSRHR